jgi:hypothetical protein
MLVGPYEKAMKAGLKYRDFGTVKYRGFILLTASRHYVVPVNNFANFIVSLTATAVRNTKRYNWNWKN